MPPHNLSTISRRYFFLGEDVLLEVPMAAQFLVTSFVVVEAADEHNGGLVYGLLTTSHNLGLAFAPPISNQIFGPWRPSLSDAANFIQDLPSFRNLVMASVALGYAFSFLAFVALPLLPRQKEDAQLRKRAWPSSDAVGHLSIGLLSSTFGYSVTIIVLSMIPSTACLKIVGGEGCETDLSG